MADMPVTVQGFVNLVREYGFEYFGFYYGNYRGLIVNTSDPLKLGRVQVRIPQLASDNKVEHWAWPKGQPAGEDFGDFMIPPVGSPVWVEFENGNPNNPIYSGGHWGKTKGAVPAEGKLASPTNRVRKSEKWIVEMNDGTDEVKISSKAGGHHFKITGDGNITHSGTGEYTKETGGAHGETIGGDRNLEVGGNDTKMIGGDSSLVATGAVGVAGASLAVNITGASTFNIGPVNFEITDTDMTITLGSSSLVLNGTDVEIMGHNFLPHTHSGVDPGGGTSGGVA